LSFAQRRVLAHVLGQKLLKPIVVLNLSSVYVSVRILGYRIDQVKLSRVVPLVAELRYQRAVLTTENPDYIIPAISNL
jgi:hypothetical protein